MYIIQASRTNQKRKIMQRIAWASMLFFLIVVLFGFNTRYYSHIVQGSDNDRVSLEFDRFLTTGAATQLQFRLNTAVSDPAKLWLSRSYLAKVEIVSIYPEPLAIEMDDNRIIYLFSPVSDGGKAEVTFTIIPREAGLQQAAYGYENEMRNYRQFVYP
jgi:hypothetical protein